MDVLGQWQKLSIGLTVPSYSSPDIQILSAIIPLSDILFNLFKQPETLALLWSFRWETSKEKFMGKCHECLNMGRIVPLPLDLGGGPQVIPFFFSS